jgi:chromate reductase
MAQARKLAVLVGSLREDSLNRKVARALARLAPQTLAFDFVEIGDLPLYNEDLDGQSPPASWQRFRDEVRATEAVLFVTPEYNRSVPGPLKNAIDVGSRPYGRSVWTGKPAAVVSVSPGAIGGFGANHHLRQSLVFLDMPVMQQPEAYLGGAGGFFDEAGEVKVEGTRAFLQTIVTSFADWIERILANPAR